MWAAARLLWFPASTTSVFRLALPSTRAALRPAAPPPTTTQSNGSRDVVWAAINENESQLIRRARNFLALPGAYGTTTTVSLGKGIECES